MYCTLSQIDDIISTEIFNKDINPKRYKAIKKFMMQGLCGGYNKDAPYMLKYKCTQHFSKNFYSQTIIDEDGLLICKRRCTRIYFYRKGILPNNCYMVPYNKDLIMKFYAHVSVVICNHSRSEKYLFKYVNK